MFPNKFAFTDISGLNGGKKQKWKPCDFLNDCSIASPVIKATATIKYTVYGTDSSGCKDSAAIDVAVVKDDVKVYIPSAFTPNNDGVNDDFGVRSTSPLQQARFTIYNRWAQIVFTSESTKSLYFFRMPMSNYLQMCAGKCFQQIYDGY
ncbi:MAG: gliding motility-associated C-terminal domain-containing protein [Ferruginibacter sp.]